MGTIEKSKVDEQSDIFQNFLKISKDLFCIFIKVKRLES